MMKTLFVLFSFLLMSAASYSQDAVQNNILEKDAAVTKESVSKKKSKTIQKKVKQTADELMFKKGSGKVFIFGVSQQLGDSIAYVTVINEIDSIDLQSKTKFLPFRQDFSIQLKEYLEGQIHLKSQTACVFYSNNRKKISKQYYKLKKRYLDDKSMKMIMVDDQLFRFSHPLDAILANDTE